VGRGVVEGGIIRHIICIRTRAIYIGPISEMLLLSTQRELPIELQRKWININADTPAENRRWLQKSKLWWYDNDDIDDIKSSKNNLQNTCSPRL